MGTLRRCAVPLVLLLGAACGDAGPAPDRVLSAAGAVGEEAPAPVPTTSTTIPTPVAPTTMTTTTRAAPVATTATTARRTRTTRAPVTATPSIAGYSPAPPPPGVLPDGYGGYGGVTSRSAGGVTVELAVYAREQYFGEMTQVGVQVAHPENVAISSVKIDFGNGHVVPSTPLASWTCGSTQDASAGSNYVYPEPGTFRITATATFVTCMGVPGMLIGPYNPPPTGLVGPWFPQPHEAVSAGMDVLQRPDRPPRPVGPPPGP